MGHATIENRHGLAVAGMVTLATGTAEEHQPVDAAERKIPSKDHADPLGLLLDDEELAILEFVSQRHHSADP
jgi:hypothetical protein